MLTRLTSVSAIAAIAVAVAASAASAAIPSCVRKGEQRSWVGGALQIQRTEKASKRWPSGTKRIYVCSPRYGKRVFAGFYGEAYADGEEAVVVEGNERFAAFTYGRYGATGGGLLSVSVADLARGKLVTKVSLPSNAYSARFSNLNRTALSKGGKLGLVVYDPDRPAGSQFVVERVEPGKRASIVASGGADLAYFLRFEPDQKTLRWSSSSVPLGSTPPSLPVPRPVKSGRCLRFGDKLIHPELGQMLIRHRIEASTWSHVYALLACSKDYKKRVSLGSFGRNEEGTVTLARIAISYAQVALVIRRSDPKGKALSNTVKLVSLFDGSLIYSGPASAEDPSAHVTSLKLGEYGVLGWISSPSAPGAPAREVHLRDIKGARVLDSNNTIDPRFLSFDFYRPLESVSPTFTYTLLWSNGVGRG